MQSAVIDNFTGVYLSFKHRHHQGEMPALQHAQICKSCPFCQHLAAVSMPLALRPAVLHLSIQCHNAAGVNLLNESNLIAGILLNTMFLLGTFTFAVVLGVVSDDISSEVKVLDHHASHMHATCCSHFGDCAHCCLLSYLGCVHCVSSSMTTSCPSETLKLVDVKKMSLHCSAYRPSIVTEKWQPVVSCITTWILPTAVNPTCIIDTCNHANWLTAHIVPERHCPACVGLQHW